MKQGTNQSQAAKAPHHTHTAIHMPIPWAKLSGADDKPAPSASLSEKTALVGRIGFMLLSAGSGAWRVRDEMNHVASALGIVCSADIGLTTVSCTCFDDAGSCTQTLSLRTSGINTYKLMEMSNFVKDFAGCVNSRSVKSFHKQLDEIDNRPGFYRAWNLGLAAGLACCAFTYLLGGGPVEMVCAFLGAGLGNFLRVLMLHRRLALFLCVVTSVAAASLVYILAVSLAEQLGVASQLHEAGYICAMLFIIPGFPLITGGLDIVKLDLRSGLERVLYALMIITVSVMTGFVTARIMGFMPNDLAGTGLPGGFKIPLRLITSFLGVYGFSLMYNSPRRMAATAGLIGMIANLVRLQLIDMAGMTPFVAAFLGALCAGVMASWVKVKTGFPRMSLTIPSIVIMVPGLYMYRGFYGIGSGELTGAPWLVSALLIVLALPTGLAFARMLTDTKFRHSI